MFTRTIAALAVLVLAVGAAPALPDPADAPPGPGDAIDAFNAVQTYLRGLDASAPAPHGLPAVDAAGITVALEGRIIADAFAAAATASDRETTLFRATAEATRKARDALATNPSARASDLTISLELSGPARSLLGEDLFAPGADWQLGAPGPALRPGIEGLILRAPDMASTRAVARTPAWMLRRGIGPNGAVAAVLGDLGGDAELTGLAAIKLLERGFTFATFEVVHLAQLEPGGAPVFLHRGGRVVEPEEATGSALPELGAHIASHLRTRLWPGVEPLGMVGALDPLRGRYDPPIAAPADQALAAAAMLAWANTARAPAESRAGARSFATQVLADLAQKTDAEPDPVATPADAAMVYIALTMPNAPASESLAKSALDTLRPLFPSAGASADLPPPLRGLVALASVRAAERGEITTGAAAECVASAFASVPTEQLVALMPFLGFASVELADLESAPVRAAPALRAMRDLTDAFRITAADVDADARDLVGGIVFTVGASPLPTWHTLRPVAFEATMLARPELTPGTPTTGEVPARLTTHATGLRFLAQLTASREEAHAYRNPAFALGGVRRAVWDHEMPIEASALALWTVAETLDALDQLRARAAEVALP